MTNELIEYEQQVDDVNDAMQHVMIPEAVLRMMPRVITSHSIDGTFESCPRRFEFMHMYEMAPEYEGSRFAADVGTAMHEAVQEWSRYAMNPQWHGEPEYAINRGLLTLAKWWPHADEAIRRENGLPVGSRSLGLAVELFKRIIENEFFLEWELVFIDGFGLAIEVPWVIVHTSFGTIPTPYVGNAYMCTQGKIDWILRHKKTGEIRVWDLKSTIKQEQVHRAAFKFSGQGPLYSLVLAHALNHDWARHGLDMTYHIAQFPTEDRDFSIYPTTFHYSPTDIQDGIDVKLERLLRLKNYATRGHFPRRSHGCDFYGSSCKYLDICESRDTDYIKKWFDFDRTHNIMSRKTRTYDALWVIQS
jgi:hypothetical protein